MSCMNLFADKYLIRKSGFIPLSGDNIFAILQKSNIFQLGKIEQNKIKIEEKESKNENKENQNCGLQGGLSAE